MSVVIDQSEIDEALDVTAKRLASQVRVPGFRPGRVPRQVLEARLGGAAALRQQALSDALPDLYARAVVDTETDPIASPDIDITSGEDGGPVTFEAVVEVRPVVTIPGYQGLVVTLPPLAASEEEVDRQVDRLREQGGELTGAERPARDGDYLTIDLFGTRPGADDLQVEDYLYELGSGSDVPGLDDELRGTKPGDILQFVAPLPGPGGEEVETSFRVLVKEVQEKVLPVADDAWAAEASEFETVEALRADLRTRIGQMKVVQAQMALRDRALEALVALVEDEAPQIMVDREVNERIHDLQHRLEARRISVEQFLQASGRDEQSLLAELRQESARAVRIDLALRALVEAESIEVTDEELEASLAEMAERDGSDPAQLRDALDHAGRLPAVRSDRRKAKALEWLLDHVELVDEDGKAVSRDELRVDLGTTEEEPEDLETGAGPDEQESDDVEVEETPVDGQP